MGRGGQGKGMGAPSTSQIKSDLVWKKHLIKQDHHERLPDNPLHHPMSQH